MESQGYSGNIEARECHRSPFDLSYAETVADVGLAIQQPSETGSAAEQVPCQIGGIFVCFALGTRLDLLIPRHRHAAVRSLVSSVYSLMSTAGYFDWVVNLWAVTGPAALAVGLSAGAAQLPNKRAKRTNAAHRIA